MTAITRPDVLPALDARALVDLVREALALPSLQPAGAGGRVGPFVVHSSAEAASPGAPSARGRRSGPRALRAVQHAVSTNGSSGGGESDRMEAEHAEAWRLVRLAQAGDGEAFGRLYDRYVDRVYRFVYFKINDRTLAEDFTSETFVRALKRIGTINYQGRDPLAWFYTIARNILLDHLKSARNRLETMTADHVERPDAAPSTENAVLASLESEQLMSAVGKLGEEQRECIVLRFVQGMSVSETATIMGKNDGAIKALQHRAIRKLADLVGPDLR